MRICIAFHSTPHLVMVFMVIGSGVNILHAVWRLIGHSLTHSMKCVCVLSNQIRNSICKCVGIFELMISIVRVHRVN